MIIVWLFYIEKYVILDYPVLLKKSYRQNSKKGMTKNLLILCVQMQTLKKSKMTVISLGRLFLICRLYSILAQFHLSVKKSIKN